MRMKPLVALLALLLVRQGSAARAQDACPGLSAEAQAVRLAGIDAHGDPELADGRRIRLAGLAPRQNAAEAARFADALLRWRDSELKLVALGAPDRWGRLPGRLLQEPGAAGLAPVDLSAELLRAKAAWRLPEPGYPACDAVLREAETGPTPARRQSRSAPQAGGLDGLDLAVLKARAGDAVILEGRVVSVGERPQRVYLNFSRRRGEGASIVIARKLWRELQDAGWTAATLKDKRIRVRGVLGGPDGLAMELSARSALELID